MRDCKFKELIINIYNDYKNRTFEKEEFGYRCVYNNYFGLLYSATSTDSLDKITDVQKYMDIANPDMIMLHSIVTNKEIEIYNWDFKDYKISNDKLIIEFNNGKVREFKL